jgi:hypothetical protein
MQGVLYSFVDLLQTSTNQLALFPYLKFHFVLKTLSW